MIFGLAIRRGLVGATAVTKRVRLCQVLVCIVGARGDTRSENITYSGNNALRSEWISHGSYVEKFENKLKNFLKVKYASSVSNGTAALQLAFLSLGLKRGDEILCPSYCYMAAANIATQMFLNIKCTYEREYF